MNTNEDISRVSRYERAPRRFRPVVRWRVHERAQVLNPEVFRRITKFPQMNERATLLCSDGAAGRTLKTFQAWESSGFTPGSDLPSVTNAIVMEPQAMDWDGAGKMPVTVRRGPPGARAGVALSLPWAPDSAFRPGNSMGRRRGFSGAEPDFQPFSGPPPRRHAGALRPQTSGLFRIPA